MGTRDSEAGRDGEHMRARHTTVHREMEPEVKYTERESNRLRLGF